jgi:ABC-type antimicrobial peptide transport system permease subunit
MFLGEAGLVTGAGLAIGTIAALALGTGMASMLFQVRPWDPTGFGVATLVVAVVAFSASVIPAIRASRTDPVDSLR